MSELKRALDKALMGVDLPKANLEMSSGQLAQSNPSLGWSALSLGVAKILDVYHEEMRCNIEVVVGEKNRPKWTGVEITAACSGSRHFLGGIPQKGDFCIVGWYANSNQGADRKQPVILTWMTRTPYFGHDWLPVQDYTAEEDVLETPKQRQSISQVGQRLRFKMRHLEQGNILASSSQGSDLVLDESVLLTNRRANEIRLRDQDQAIVMRSLQQFHTMSGARVYAGMVQRDAQHIPKEMISDGKTWDGEMQIDLEGLPLSEAEFPDSEYPLNKLTPHKLFLRDSEGKTEFSKDEGFINPWLDPYVFFLEAGLINEDHFVSSRSGEALYGGKSILRLDSKGDDVSLSGGALSEYRIEVSHTTDGTLPVTEQTDGFDSNRLSGEAPLVEFVMGSVVGNDPFGTERQTYGVPLGVSFSGGVGKLQSSITGSIGDQAATLLKINPLDTRLEDSFISFTKNGSLKAQISERSQNAFQARVEGGASVSTGGSFRLNSSTVFIEGSRKGANAFGVEITSRKNAVHIFGGGNVVPNNGATGQFVEEEPISVNLAGVKGIALQSGSVIKMTAPVLDFTNVRSIRYGAQETLNMSSGKSVTTDTTNIKEIATGSKQTVVSGPGDVNPLNPQGIDEQITCSPATGSVGGAVKNETVYFGDVNKTTVLAGDRNTTVTLGNINHTSYLGSVVSKSALNEIALNPDSISVKAKLGNIDIAAVAGKVSISSSLGVDVTSSGPVNIVGASILLTGKAGSPVGGNVLCGSDLHPLIGKPYAVLGMIPRTINLATA